MPQVDFNVFLSIILPFTFLLLYLFFNISFTSIIILNWLKTLENLFSINSVQATRFEIKTFLDTNNEKMAFKK